MLPAPLQDGTIPLLREVASFAQHRQSVLAGNVANINTPDYRMRDLPVASFQDSLKAEVERHSAESDDGVERWSFAAVDKPAAGADTTKTLQDARHHNLTFQDGNNRSIEEELMEMSQNSMMFQTSLELLKLQFQRANMVISERVA